MITVPELKAKAAGRYKSTLKKLLLGKNPFPVSIPYKRPRRIGDPSAILHVKELLRSQSKETVGFGPTVQFDEASTRRFGAGALPGAITFDTLEDLTRYIGRQVEAKRILEHAGIVTREFPAINAWTATRLNLLCEGDVAMWRGITKVVAHFIQNPKPWIYPREVLLGLPTKFLEQNHRPIIEILAEVAPATLNECYTNWQDRLGLRSSSDLVEGRFLDPALAPHLPQHMLAPVSEWNRCAFVSPTWVLIVENRTSLLTLPNLRGCLALLGKGYAVTRLAQIEKLHRAETFYWGDIDQHGFEILASLRGHLPKVLSCLMDEETLTLCHNQIEIENVDATLPGDFVASHLTTSERVLWERCGNEHLRIEQEHIRRDVAISALNALATKARNSFNT
ncbi:MAG TPA: Wadjet anti-phage system protein JetD domain-containing protein [Verrucomicrobiae bacterium]|nr:Wadjet anti-phage system protein JetD domain-containing protein [Verrucomicrobiae bacterium]